MATTQKKKTAGIEHLPELTENDFRLIIGKKAKEKSKSIFKNGSPGNANIVASNIFKNSDLEVRIYADNMDGEIADCLPDYRQEALIYLSKPNTKLTIVLEKIEEKKSNAFLDFLNHRKLIPERVKIYKASKEFSDSISKYEVANSHDLRFMTGDSDNFRLQYNKETKSAYFSFNNSNITKTLITVFDANVASCELI